MIRLAFNIREDLELDRRHVPPISEVIRGSGYDYEGYEIESSPRTCSIGRPAGDTLCFRPITLHYGVVLD